MHAIRSRRTRRSHALRAGVLAATLLAAVPALAKIDLVTLPGRDTTQLSIYKSEDLTLVRETRSLTFAEGPNEIQFSWANTLIDPTSVQIRVLKDDGSFVVLDAKYPANTQNTVVWTIEAKKGGAAQVEISCFCSGVTWRADYKLFANADETMVRLEPAFTITNTSGEDFEGAQTRLVVGEVNLVETIAELARRGMIVAGREMDARKAMAKSVMRQEQDNTLYDLAAAPAMAESFAFGGSLDEAKQIVKAAVSEYYLYTVEGTEDLENGWGKQLPNPAYVDVPVEMRYEYDPRRWGGSLVKLYKWKNDTEHEMGDTPMPEGQFYVYSDDGRGGLRFQANTQHKYVPVGEEYELNLGNDGRVILEEREMAEKRSNFEFDRNGDPIGWDTTTTIEVELRNSHARTVPVKVVRQIWGDWELEKPSDKFKTIDRNTIEWEVEVPANGKKVIKFDQVEHQGSRAKNN